MKALLYSAWDQLEVRDVPELKPQPGEVVVRVAAGDLQTAIGLFAHGKIEIAPWVKPFPLAEGARVFRELVTAPPEDYIKALLLP